MTLVGCRIEVPPGFCSVEGCDRKARTRGWCKMHYKRWWRHGDVSQRQIRRPAPVLERIKARCIIDAASGCWIWQGATRCGYGALSTGSKTDGTRQIAGAHRAAWEAVNGPVPPGLHLDHFHCDNPPCCNPAHVRPVTPRENILRGDSFPSANLAKTHCPAGHPYDEANTRISKRGQRNCRQCDREQRRKRRHP